MSSTPAPEWMFITPHSAIDETRWHQLTQLLCQLFKASAGALAQYQDGDARLLSVKQNKNVGLTQGSIESVESLMSRLANPSLPSEGIWQHGLIQLPLYWPGGQMFGAVLLVCDRLPPNIETCQTLAAPIVDFMQAQLKLYRQAKQMERLSLQDDATQMLNSHGFNLMAPRQLNLSRRLGSHAGLVVMENGTQYQGHAKEDSMRALAQVVFDNLREADLAARVDDQIILLAFVDSEANLDSLVTRLRKQFARKLEPQRVLTGHSFFTPDSHLGLTPMLAQANEELQATRARLYPKAVLADNKELPASAPINIPSPDDSPANVSIEPTESTEVMAEASKATEEYSENSGDMPLQQDSLEQTSNEQATMPPAIGNDEPATETKTAAVNEEQDV
ncbi:GGDEF domain-containing protein, partial [Shewanella sp.]|uniref:GGDEF domain-containing protein n=1 Tax=Shewanella sp. TaxID=50422 RepID=UPI0035676903